MGLENDRLIAVPLPSPGTPLDTDAYTEISDLPQGTTRGDQEFFGGLFLGPGARNKDQRCRRGTGSDENHC